MGDTEGGRSRGRSRGFEILRERPREERGQIEAQRLRGKRCAGSDTNLLQLHQSSEHLVESLRREVPYLKKRPSEQGISSPLLTGDKSRQNRLTFSLTSSYSPNQASILSITFLRRKLLVLPPPSTPEVVLKDERSPNASKNQRTKKKHRRAKGRGLVRSSNLIELNRQSIPSSLLLILLLCSTLLQTHPPPPSPFSHLSLSLYPKTHELTAPASSIHQSNFFPTPGILPFSFPPPPFSMLLFA